MSLTSRAQHLLGPLLPKPGGKPPSVRPLGILFLIVGIGAGVVFLNTPVFVAQAISTPGFVIKLESRAVNRGQGVVAVFTFTDATGQPHTNRAGLAMIPPTHQVGETVTVLYTAGQPETALIRGFWTLWYTPLATGFISVFSIVIGLAALRKPLARVARPNDAMNLTQPLR